MSVSGLERRRLFAYSIFFISGIISGYFILEINKVAAGLLFFLSIGVLIRTTLGSKKFIYASIIILATGFMIFAINYISSERMPHYIDNKRAIYLSESEIESVGLLSGTVISYKFKEEKIQIIISDSESVFDGREIKFGKVQANISIDLVNEFVDEYTELIGSRITLYGDIYRPEKAMNPGCFDYRLYLKTQSVKFIMRANSIGEITYLDEINRKGSSIKFFSHILRLKHLRMMVRLRERFLNEFNDDEVRGFVRGIIFGDKTEIDEETRELFNVNGTGHILAVSGLHVGFLYSLIKFINGRKRNLSSTIITIAVLVFYGEMTMWSASTIRAVLVLSMSLLSRHVKRPFDLLTSVSTAAITILIVNPYQLFNSGFQLSFMALTSIAFLCRPLSAIFGEKLAMILSVQIGIVPVSAYLFNRLNLLSMFINIPVIALSSIIVPYYMIMLLIFIFSGRLLSIAVITAEGLESMMIRLNEVLSLNGTFQNQIVTINPGIITFAYLAIFFIFSEWFRVKYFRNEIQQILQASACIIISAAIIFFCSYNEFINDDAIFVSVGQGSCIHLRTPTNKNILIDGGGSTEYNVGDKILRTYLLKNGVKKIDLAIATHLDTDHYKGLEELNELGMIGRLITNRDGYSAGDIIYQEKDFRLTAVAPLKGRTSSDSMEENEMSLVIRADYKNFSLLATGDIGKETENELNEYWSRSSSYIGLPFTLTNMLDVDVLAVAHHGSKNSSSEEFVDATSPDIAVIQVGKNNIYGHPAPETIDTLNGAGIKIYRNDTHGAVGIDRKLKVDIVESG